MEHTPASFEVPELEKILAKKKKRYVGYEEGMALYSMRKISFRKLAQEAHALLRIKKMAIVDLDILDDYLEQGSEGGMETFTAKFQQPEQALEKSEVKKMLVEALQTLTENEQKVITLYYYEELTLKEISMILEVSESRVSQLHTKALKKIKKQLGDSIDFINLF